MQRSVWSVVSVCVLVSGCIETDLRRDPPVGLGEPLSEACIDVQPRRVEFNNVDLTGELQDVEERVLTISNSCEGDLEIDSVQVQGAAPDGVFKVSNLGDVLLRTAETTTFVVTFSPKTAGTFEGRISVRSNAAATPETMVRLQGLGTAPRIEVSPGEVDYGSPYIGCEQDQAYTITNSGNADLIVTGIEPYTASTEEFSVDLDPVTNGSLPFRIAPLDGTSGGPAVDVYLDYVPLDTFRDEAFLAFSSNDPLVPEKVAAARGAGTKYGDNLDVFEQPIRSASDILFTLDRSGSMYDNNENVINNFDVFVSTLSSLDADFHAAVVVGDDGCVAGPDPYIDGSYSEAAAVEAFRVMADPGRILKPGGTNTERGYMLAEAALSDDNVRVGGCNAEFYREDAFLSLVHVSDEPEQSVSSWSYYVSLFQSLKSDPDDVVINAVAGDYPTGCGSASAGTGYYEGTVATGGLFLSICATDWAKNLEDLASESVAINDSFELSQKPVPQTLEVKIDGVRVGVGWEYDIASNSVVFDNDFIPAGGSQIEVYYERLPSCEG